VPELSLASIQLLLAHGGIPGLIAETGSVFVALAVFGFFIRRSAKKEREREDESDRSAR
jgi:FtsH-binding integral membrane protein